MVVLRLMPGSLTLLSGVFSSTGPAGYPREQANNKNWEGKRAETKPNVNPGSSKPHLCDLGQSTLPPLEPQFLCLSNGAIVESIHTG